jgi:hypothetical protein
MNVLLPLIIISAGFFNNVETPELVTSLASIITESVAVAEVTEQEAVVTEAVVTEAIVTEAVESEIAVPNHAGIVYVDEAWSHLTPSTREAILMLVEADQMLRIE